MKSMELDDYEKKVVDALYERDMSDREVSIVTKIPVNDIRKTISMLKHSGVIKEI